MKRRLLAALGLLCGPALCGAAEFQPGRAVAAAHAAIREAIPFLDRDRALDGEVAAAVRLVRDGSVLSAARSV